MGVCIQLLFFLHCLNILQQGNLGFVNIMTVKLSRLIGILNTAKSRLTMDHDYGLRLREV